MESSAVPVLDLHFQCDISANAGISARQIKKMSVKVLIYQGHIEVEQVQLEQFSLFFSGSFGSHRLLP